MNKTELKFNPLIPVLPNPTKFTLDEWHLNRNQTFRNTNNQQLLADSILSESNRLRQQIGEITKDNRKQSDYLIEQKIKDIEFNKHEIDLQRKEICLEIDNLETYTERILDTLKSVDGNALEIIQKCLVLREHRIGIDLCEDIVEKQLRKEMDVVEGARKLLQRTLEQANEQIRRLRSTVYFIDRDLEDKGNVLKTDSFNLSLRETDLNLSMYHGFAPLDPAKITGQEWQEFTTINIERAAKEINNARQLRTYVDTLLSQVIDDLTNQYHLVNESFRQRIEELKITKTKLEQQHSEIARQINDMTVNITNLEIAIAEKEGFLALAHTRLGNRAQRSGIELCKDSLELSLINECRELRENLTLLQQMMNEAQASRRYLLKIQLQLEEELNIKTNSLKIDEVDCMTLRQNMDYHSY